MMRQLRAHAAGRQNLIDAAAGAARGAQVDVAGVTHRYRRGAEVALADVSMALHPGSMTALVGRSGSGKSTLLHVVAGLMRPTEGSVRIDGHSVQGPSPSRVVMFQQPCLLPWMSVAGNVGLGLRFLGRREGQDAKIAELLQLVELEALADRNVQDLSGGQQQRVALARSLAVEPALLMLDEPFSALDAITRAHLQRDLRAIVRRLGLTLILVTHDIGEAVLMADRTLVMAQGRITADFELRWGEERSPLDPRCIEARRRIEDALESQARPAARKPAHGVTTSTMDRLSAPAIQAC
jgi:ABC-type nitrate/sulfonate/bicarbonate transport system ATPase subunit